MIRALSSSTYVLHATFCPSDNAALERLAFVNSGGSYKVVRLFFWGVYVFCSVVCFYFCYFAFYDCIVNETSRRQYLNTKFYHGNH